MPTEHGNRYTIFNLIDITFDVDKFVVVVDFFTHNHTSTHNIMAIESTNSVKVVNENLKDQKYFIFIHAVGNARHHIFKSSILRPNDGGCKVTIRNQRS